MKNNLGFTIDFMGIGTPKCGTEWVVACLREHPEIDFSKHKEINYFLSPTKGVTNFVYENIRIKTPKEYKKQFSWEKNKKRGVWNNHYIFDNSALEKVKRAFPDIKIIVALRNPVKYLYSIYWYLKYSHIYHLIPETFEKALETKIKDDLYNKKNAKFGTLLKNVKKIFGNENVFVVLVDDIKEKPDRAIKALYKFLEVDPEFNPESAFKRINPTKEIRFPILMKYIHKLVETITKSGYGNLINDLINTANPIKKIYKLIMHKDQKYPPIKPDTEKKLKKYYKKEVEILEKLLKRNLDDWK